MNVKRINVQDEDNKYFKTCIRKSVELLTKCIITLVSSVVIQLFDFMVNCSTLSADHMLHSSPGEFS